MEPKIPEIVEELYNALIGEPKPHLWPEYLQKEPLRAHGMWAFYQGLQTGLQLAAACLERE